MECCPVSILIIAACKYLKCWQEIIWDVGSATLDTHSSSSMKNYPLRFTLLADLLPHPVLSCASCKVKATSFFINLSIYSLLCCSFSKGAFTLASGVVVHQSLK